MISIGDGGNREMLLAMRKHANFVEVVPLCLVLIGILELNGVTPYAVHGLGGGLLVFRIVHAVSLKADTITNTLIALLPQEPATFSIAAATGV